MEAEALFPDERSTVAALNLLMLQYVNSNFGNLGLNLRHAKMKQLYSLT